MSKLFFERRLSLSINGFRTFEQFLNSHLNRLLPSTHENYTKDSLFLQPVQGLFANFPTVGNASWTSGKKMGEILPERAGQNKDFEVDDLLPWSEEMKSWFSAV